MASIRKKYPTSRPGPRLIAELSHVAQSKLNAIAGVYHSPAASCLLGAASGAVLQDLRTLRPLQTTCSLTTTASHLRELRPRVDLHLRADRQQLAPRAIRDQTWAWPPYSFPLLIGCLSPRAPIWGVPTPCL
jgi:hypothetical protein